MTTKMNYQVNGFSITNEVREITPAEASDILAKHNTKNRRPNKNHVKALALNMVNGTWRYNADPLRFDANGVLIDGQHRLMAVCQAQKTIFFSIVRGLDPECFKAIDVEMKTRNLTDLFFLDNISDATSMGAIVNRYFALSSGRAALSTPRSNGAGASTKDIATKATAEQRYDFYWENEKLFNEICLYSRSMYKRMRIMSVSDIGGLFALLFIDKHHSYDEVIAFFNQLYISSESKCINDLRSRLINDLTATKKMSGSHRQNLIAKVWNFYIKGKDVKVLAYNPTTEGTIEFI